MPVESAQIACPFPMLLSKFDRVELYQTPKFHFFGVVPKSRFRSSSQCNAFFARHHCYLSTPPPPNNDACSRGGGKHRPLLHRHPPRHVHRERGLHRGLGSRGPLASISGPPRVQFSFSLSSASPQVCDLPNICLF